MKRIERRRHPRHRAEDLRAFARSSTSTTAAGFWMATRRTWATRSTDRAAVTQRGSSVQGDGCGAEGLHGGAEGQRVAGAVCVAGSGVCPRGGGDGADRESRVCPVNSRLEDACRRLSAEMQAAVLLLIEALASAPGSSATDARKASGSFGPWLTAESAAKYLDFTAECKNPREAFRRFAKRHGIIPRGSVGERPRWHRNDLDRAVTLFEEETTRRSRKASTTGSRRMR